MHNKPYLTIETFHSLRNKYRIINENKRIIHLIKYKKKELKSYCFNKSCAT